MGKNIGPFLFHLFCSLNPFESPGVLDSDVAECGRPLFIINM